MIRIQEGDLLECDLQILAHQVNCRGSFGAGLAGQMAEKWPALRASYQRFVKDHSPEELLGGIYVWEGLGVTVVNLFGQDEPGPNTDVSALYTSIQALNDYMALEGFETVGLPWGIGCGIGGADWKEVRKMVESQFSGTERHLVWVKRD